MSPGIDPTRPAPVRATRTTRRPDRTGLVRSGCCRPVACAPNVGVRCCASPRCSCVFPTTIGVAWRYAGEPTPTPTPERAPERARWQDLNVRFPVYVGGAVVATGAIGGIAWGVFLAVAWVVEHALLIGGGFAGIAFLCALLGGGRRTFSGTFKGRMD